MPSKLLNSYLPELFALGIVRTKPSMVTVNLTKRCNQHCLYCEIGKSPPSLHTDILSKEDIYWILDEMVKYKIPKISLCGGEPFLFEGLFEILEYAHKKKIRVSVTSNGMTIHKLTEDQLNILRDCKTEINLSVDSFNERIQSITRGTSAALPNALLSLQKLREKGISATVLCVISTYNYTDLFNFVTTATEKGIKQLLFQPVIYASNYPDSPGISQKTKLNVSVEMLDNLMEELQKILRFERNHQIKTNVYRILPWIRSYLQTAEKQDGEWFFKGVLRKFFCREVFAIIDISYDGGIQPCGLTPATSTIFSERGKGLLSLWNKATEKIRHDMKHEQYYDYCNACCHHFSRNMLASILKYPLQNREAIWNMLPLIFLRLYYRIIKQLT